MNSKPTNELEWLFYHLWLKTGPAPPQFIFTIAETIFYRQNDQGYSFADVDIPDSWYFTSKDGYILKKNKFNVSTKEIHKAFSKKLETHDQVAAVAFYQQQNILNESVDIHVQYLPPTDFKAHLFYNSDSSSSKQAFQLYALQKFVQCKSIKHTMYKCAWSQGALPVIEKLQNLNSFYDSKVQLSERTPTFETNCELISALEKGSVPQQVTDNIIRSIKQITSHIQENARIDLQSGVFYFKIDKKTDVLYLIFATNLQLTPSQQSSHRALLGIKSECRIISYQRKAQFDISSIHQSFEQQQPIVNIVPNLKQQTKNRPQTGRQGSKIDNNCPFCEKKLNNEGEELSFEITVNQILKFHQKLNRNIELKISQTKFIKSIKNCNEKKIPEALGRAFPKLNEIKLQRQRQDPEFLYDFIKMCEECYLSYKEILQVIKKKSVKNKDLDLTNDQASNSQASQSVRNIETKSGQDFTLPMLYPKNNLNMQAPDIQRISNQQDSKLGDFNTEWKVQESKVTEENRSSDLKSISQSVYTKITGLDEKSRQLLHEQSKSRLSQLSKESKEEQKQPMFMMFSKVEAGKEVSDALVKIKRDSSSDNIKVIEKFEQAPKQKEQDPIEIKSRGRIIGQRLSNKSEKLDENNEETISQNKRKSQQNLLGRQYSKGRKENFMSKNNSQLQKIEWQKSYQESIKAKTREIKNQILETCDKIESGEFSQPLSSKQDNSEIDQILNFYKPNNNSSHAQILTLNGKKMEQAQVVDESRMFENITPIIFDIDTQQSERIVSLKKRRGQPNQPNNVRQQLPLPIKIESKRKTIVEKVESTSPSERRPSQKQRLMTAYGMGNLAKCALIPAQRSLNRQRPQSSKPPLHQAYNTTSHQSNTINQRGNSIEPIDDERFNVKKKQRPQTHKSVRPKPTQQQVPATTNLLDFNNMSEEHIKEIANKADQLIEIIQNIKDKVGVKQSDANIKEVEMYEENKNSQSWW